MACARDQTPSLSNMFAAWSRTVLSLICIRLAMFALLRPATISVRTWRSRTD